MMKGEQDNKGPELLNSSVEDEDEKIPIIDESPIVEDMSIKDELDITNVEDWERHFRRANYSQY